MCCICLRLRCVTQPDAAQAALLDRRDITLPKRMRLAERELPTSAAAASSIKPSVVQTFRLRP